MLMASLDTSIANAALPALARAFDASFESVRWVVLGYLLTLTAFTVLAGRLGDRLGRRRTLLAATLMFTLASSVCSVAPTLPVLLAARAAQGLAAAAMTALSLAFIHEIVPASSTGRAIGVLGTMSAIGTTLGPSLGGMLTARFGWEAIFLVNVPIGIAALLLGFLHLPVHPSATTQSPLFDSAVLRARTATAGLAANALVSSVMMTTLVVGPFYLSRSLGLSDGAVGVALSVGPLVAALSGIPAGWLIDRYSAERMTIVGLIGLAIATPLVGLLPLSAGATGYLLAISGMTAAYAVFQAANNTHLMATTESRSRGATAGLIGLARNLGLIAGASVMGAVFAWGVGPGGVTDAPPDVVAAGVRTTFRIAALLIGVAIAAVMFDRTVRRPHLNHTSTVTHSEGR
jgi:MFS family permease